MYSVGVTGNWEACCTQPRPWIHFKTATWRQRTLVLVNDARFNEIQISGQVTVWGGNVNNNTALTAFIRPICTAIVFILLIFWQEQYSSGVEVTLLCLSPQYFSTLLWTVFLMSSESAYVRLHETFPTSKQRTCVSAAGKLRIFQFQCGHCWLMKGDFLNRVSHYCRHKQAQYTLMSWRQICPFM